MLGAVSGIHSISKISEAIVGLYESKAKKERAVKDIEKLQKYFDKESGIFAFLTDHFADKETKIAVIEELRKGGVDGYLTNALCFMVDSNLIFHLKLFLSTLRTRLHKSLNIRTIFVYSSFEISKPQKKKIEELWRVRLPQSICEFVYAIDKSLKLGIKVQVGNYVEEFSVKSNLSLLELKLDSSLFSI